MDSLEIHLIQSVPAQNMNRGGDRQPKTMVLGGHTRARLSSQTQKRAAREYTLAHGLLPEAQRAQRTQRLAQLVASRLEAQGLESEHAIRLTERALAASGIALTEDKRTEYLVFVSPAEVEALATAVGQFRAELDDQEVDESAPKRSKKERKAEASPGLQRAITGVFERSQNLELLLYGRMLADLKSGRVDGAVQVMHAFSTHAITPQIDYFNAIDDLERESNATRMIGERGFNAATFYRAAAVNLGELRRHTSPEAATAAARAFAEAFIGSLPGAGHNAFLARTLPTFVLLQRRLDHHPLVYSDGFLTPINAGYGRSENLASQDALLKARDWLTKTFPRAAKVSAAHAIAQEGILPDDITRHETLVGAITAALA
jgi:CRISPR system Cascade subunit CasC